MPSRPAYLCIHCGEPCGVTGHLKRLPANLFGVDGEWCPNAGLVPLTAHGEVRLGFSCRPGHTCLTAQTGLGFTSTMTAPIEKRNWRDHRPTPGQLDFLAALHYTGPSPVTKGQAHDLIDRILKGEPQAQLDALRSRGIRLRQD